MHNNLVPRLKTFLTKSINSIFYRYKLKMGKYNNYYKKLNPGKSISKFNKLPCLKKAILFVVIWNNSNLLY